VNDVNDDVEGYASEVDEHEGDELDLFESGEETAAPKRKPRRRTVLLAILLVVLIGGGWGVYYGAGVFLGVGSYGNYGGDGDSDVLVQVDNGATTRDIAEKLRSQDVVRTARGVPQRLGRQRRRRQRAGPATTSMKTHMSGGAAVTRLVAPATPRRQRADQGGEQLDDTRNPDNSVKPGVLSEIATASCATLNGRQEVCVGRRPAQGGADRRPGQLGLPDWAVPEVAKADPAHRMEGLIVVWRVRHPARD